MKAFAGIKIEISCTDLAYVDKSAKEKNFPKKILSYQDLLDRTVDDRRKETNCSKETVGWYSDVISQKNPPIKT